MGKQEKGEIQFKKTGRKNGHTFLVTRKKSMSNIYLYIVNINVEHTMLVVK